MAIKYEDECVGCPSEMGCLGDRCPYMNVPHFTCDECNEDFDSDELYDYEGLMLCRDCLLEVVPKIDAERIISDS